MKKRIFALILALCTLAVLAVVLSVTVFADGSPTYAFDYDTGTLTISGTGTVTYEGVKQTIGDAAYGSMITALVVEDGVTSIDTEVFKGCNELVSVIFKGDLTIGYQAFIGCTKLESVRIDGDVCIGGGAFSECSKLKTVNISGNVSRIDEKAFGDCTPTTTICIYGDVTTIVQQGFLGLHGSLYIYGDIGSVGENAFRACENLSLHVFGDVETIADNAFSFCENITIYGYAGSKLQAFANDQITFVPLTLKVTDGVAGKDYTYDGASGILTVLTDKSMTIANVDPTTATSHRIVVKKDISAKITLAGVNIAVSTGSPFEIEAGSKGNVTITLADDTTNTLKATNYSYYAALQKEGSGTDIGKLTIQGGTAGNGKLIAESYIGAGIGGNTPYGGNSSAAVSNITITGGMVMAKSSSGAGIGSGYVYGDSGSVSNITITGGSVTATGEYAVGIGSGTGISSSGHVSNITITGGCVTANVGSGEVDYGIYGTKGTVSNIVITGGSVKVSLGCTPTDGSNTVTLFELDNSDGKDVTIDGKSYPTAHKYYDGSAWQTEKKVYLYLNSKGHFVTVGDTLSVLSSGSLLPTSGDCSGTGENDNVTWKLSSDGTMTISGTGAMKDYASYNDQPWKDIRDLIKKVVIKDGVTRVGTAAFSICTKLRSVDASNSCKYFGFCAFATCSELTHINISGDASFGDNVFTNVTCVTALTVGGDLTISPNSFYNASFESVSIGGNVNDLSYPDAELNFGDEGGCTKMYIFGSIGNFDRIRQNSGRVTTTVYSYESNRAKIEAATGATYAPIPLKITGGTLGKDYTYDVAGGVLTVLTPTPLTIENVDKDTATSHRIVVAKDVDANITLAGVNIAINAPTGSPFEIEKGSEGDVTITLADGMTNTLKIGSYSYAALQKEGDGENIGTLTIKGGTQGTGELLAEAVNGAGIGSGRGDFGSGSTSNITISGGYVTAKSSGGAGIGSGTGDPMSGNVSNITITGGCVTANSTEGAGIGSGRGDFGSGSTSNIVITGGSVKASSLGCTPTDGKGNDVYLLTVNTSNSETSSGDIVSINGKDYPAWHYFYCFYSTGGGAWGANPEIYVYLPDATHSVTVGDNTTVMFYNSTSSSFENATIWLLDSTGTLKGGYGDLQKAVDAAVAGDLLELHGNVDTAATVEINKNLTLDLNGYVLKMTGNGSVLKVTSGATLTLKDSNTTKPHKFTPNSDGLWELNETGGTETVNGGVITGGNVTLRHAYGGGVYVDANSHLVMSGGNIVGCTVIAEYTGDGGGVYVGQNGSFTMSDGSIIGCTASSGNSSARGGGVCVNVGGSFGMSGGTIGGCEATKGGGVYCIGSITMSGDAKITLCTATSGAAIHLGGTMYANGGTVDGDVNLNDATIKRNSTDNGIESYTKFTGSITFANGASIDDSACLYRITLCRDGKTDVVINLLRGQALVVPESILTSDEVVLGWYLVEGETETKINDISTFLYDGTTERAVGTYTLKVDVVGDKLDDLNTAIKDLETANNELKDALAGKADSNVVNGKINDVNNAITNLQTELNSKANASTLDDLSNVVSTLQDAVSTLESAQSDYSTTDQMNDAITLAVENAKTGLNTTISELQDRLTAAEQKVNDLTSGKADKTELETAVNELKALINALDAVKNDYVGADTELKAELQAQIDTANTALEAAEERLDQLESDMNKAQADITKLTTDLENAQKALNKAISDGDADLNGKISDLTTALANAKAALEKSDSDSSSELNKAIADAQTALQTAIDKIASDLADSKAELEAKNNEQDAKDNELQTFVTVVCVIASVSLAGNVAIVSTTFIIKFKRKH